jgi:hypothetical protein
MDINHTLFSQMKYNKTSSHPQAASQEISNPEVTVSTVSQIKHPPDFNEGQIIKGKVIDLRYNSVSIQLEPGGQVITAKIEGEIPLSIGQIAKFQITTNSSDKVTLKYLPVSAKTLTDTTIIKALIASNLLQTDRNKTLVMELLKHRMSIDKHSLQSFVKLSCQNPEASPLTLVLMHKYQIPITKTNILQFKTYQNGTNQLLDQLNTITDNVIKALQKTDDAIFNESHQEIKSISTVHTSDTPLTNSSYNTDHIPDIEAISADSTEIYDKLSPAKYKAMITINNKLINILTTGSDNCNSIIKKANILLQDILSPEEIDNFIELTRDDAGNDGLESQPPNENADLNMVLKSIKESLPGLSKFTVRHLLLSPEYGKLIKEAFHQKWTITPEKLMEKDDVLKLYKDLEQDLKQLSELAKISAEVQKETSLQEPIKNLQDNISFLKQFNETFTYLQLPVQLKEQDVHSDLYVFTKKNAKKTDGSLNVLLHLDMEHLGSINIQIYMVAKNISARFYLEDASVVPLISENISLLKQSLSSKGYSLRTEVHDTYVKPNFVNDLVEHNSEENYSTRFSFDVRT